MKTYALKLNITGESLHSQKAVATLERLRREDRQADCDVSVVDVLTGPDQAATDKILDIPMLIRRRPTPGRRVSGDLSDIWAEAPV
jgi:circadian clock protein KaiB